MTGTIFKAFEMIYKKIHMTASNSLSKKYKNCLKISGRTARILKLAGFHLWMDMNKKYLVTYAGTFFFNHS